MGKRRKVIIFAVCMLLSLICAQTAFADSETSYRVYYDGKSTGQSGFYVKGNIYLPVSMIGSYFNNSAVTVDTANKRLNLDTSLMNIMMADSETTALVKNYAGVVYVPLKEINDTLCFSINTMEQFFNTSCNFSDGSIKLKAYDRSEKIAKVGKNAVKASPSLFSESENSITLAAGEQVFVGGETTNYYKISDFDNNVYYVSKNDITVEDLDLSTVDFYAPRKNKYKQSANEKINVAWQYVNEVTPDAPARTDGVDILAPTWFRLIVEGGGAVTNSADKGYTDLCHSRGFMVWATITNNMSEKGSTNFTEKMFSDSSIQKKAIAQYLFYSCLYDVDGINIDFEDLKDSHANGFTAFTKELRSYTERQGLNLSVDTLVPKPWTVEYDRDELAKYVDYLAVMSYDEHYAGSTVPGSVSSLPFVIEAIEGCLDEGVPAEKLLMGVPMYTRVWVVDGSGKIVSNSAVTMIRMNEILSEKNLTPTYLKKEMQNYVEYPASGGTARVWIEDQTSITNRLALVNKYDIAGSACWQFSQGTNDIWTVFDRYLH